MASDDVECNGASSKCFAPHERAMRWFSKLGEDMTPEVKKDGCRRSLRSLFLHCMSQTAKTPSGHRGAGYSTLMFNSAARGAYFVESSLAALLPCRLCSRFCDAAFLSSVRTAAATALMPIGL
jgi:hypothetical protein